MQLTLKVTFEDTAHTVTTNMMTIVMWERKYKRKASQMSEGIGMEDLAFMAHTALQQNGVVVPVVLDDFIKRLTQLEVIDSESENPT